MLSWRQESCNLGLDLDLVRRKLLEHPSNRINYVPLLPSKLHLISCSKTDTCDKIEIRWCCFRYSMNDQIENSHIHNQTAATKNILVLDLDHASLLNVNDLLKIKKKSVCDQLLNVRLKSDVTCNSFKKKPDNPLYTLTLYTNGNLYQLPLFYSIRLTICVISLLNKNLDA